MPSSDPPAPEPQQPDAQQPDPQRLDTRRVDPQPLDPTALTADRLAQLLTGDGDGLSDPRARDLCFEAEPTVRRLDRLPAPHDTWAVDGGQALVADARCLQVYATRTSRVHWQDSRSVMEEEGELRVHLLGCGEERRALAALGAPVDPRAPVDVNLLRDWGEWEAIAAAVAAAEPDSMVLVDGDLQPDWRISAAWLADVLTTAVDRHIHLVGVTKHSSLARGGAPLLAHLERQAEMALGARATWWSPVATTRPDAGPGLQVTVARLDPDARFSFRVDLPGPLDAATVLGRLSAITDDAAFPGYPYPLSVADRLAACPGWVRNDLWDRISDRFDRLGVPLDVRDRAFADRHRLMERA